MIIAVGYMGDKIIKEYMNRSEYNFEILFSVEKELLGTGGAIKKALEYTTTNAILALNGDSYIDVNLDDLIRNHIKKNAAITIVLKEVENTKRYGTVKLDKGYRIVSFEEKKTEQTGGYINAGMYIFKRELFDDVEENKVLSLEKELLPVFLERLVYGYITDRKFIDIGVPESYKLSNKFFKDMRA